ncbi:2-methylisocitrate lyase-like PEP mutase family enzyme [Litoreibacter halocynthiae]|uniref:2-methylisocitrate lyase-like PEP mutase family enzyme n=1 Tax=Litoreibacter halocynthiae TaxID=1242689 RepID=A0A4R7LP82_9RHOB|nr:isocitrate lyase/phosphoenolpyruvate mutase family protein [Litoreibacter halocynthiae]TDT77903.1 2-methylisocitrate lyase-like PEP mutase family enzyme [Litoreibacter halocynthiae]
MSFREMHKPGDPFILANAWDVGSAKMLAALGAQAIGTSSAAHAFTLGKSDGGKVERDVALAHAQDLIAAVSVPVSGDFEDGFGEAPETCAETVRLSGEIGLAGICIEDTIEASNRFYDFDLAVERVRAASSAARALKNDFFFVARADGVMTGAYDIDEAIRRIRAFDEAGADGLYVPMPKSMDDLKRVIDATEKPVNVLVAGAYSKHALAEYAALGAARISLGSALARATHRVIHDAGLSMFGSGDFTHLTNAISGSEVDKLIG